MMQIMDSIYPYMKIQMTRTVLVEFYQVRADELWDKTLNKWDTLCIEKIDEHGKTANLITYDGDVWQSVPVDSYKVV